MNIFHKSIDYFLTGIGFGAVSYLCILAIVCPGVAPTIKGVFSVFLISGLIGLLSMVISSDLPLTWAVIIHLVGTFVLFLVMAWVNDWPIEWQTIIIFIITYLCIWLVCFVQQRQSIRRINRQLQKRNHPKNY